MNTEGVSVVVGSDKARDVRLSGAVAGRGVAYLAQHSWNPWFLRWRVVPDGSTVGAGWR